MSDKDVKINLKTTADTSGATETEKALVRVEDKVHLIGTVDGFSALEGKAKVATGATYDLDAALTKTRNTIEDTAQGPIQNFSKATTQAGDNSRKMAGFVTQAGYQVTDFATQVGGGTSAITAFAQQAPQLLGALGGVGLIAGPAAIALGVLSAAIPIVLFGGRALIGMMEDSKGAAAGATKGVEDLAKKMREFKELDLQEEIDQIDTARLAAIGLEQDWDLTKQAEKEAATSTLSNAEKILKARTLIATALGLEIDKMQEIQRMAEAEQAKRELATQQAIAAENQLIQKAEEKIEKMRQDREIQLDRARDTKFDLQDAQKKLELLEKQKKAQEEIIQAASEAPIAPFSMASSAGPEQQAQRNAVGAAKSAIEDPKNNQEIANLKEEVDRLNEVFIKYTNDGVGIIAKTSQRIAEAEVNLVDKKQAAEVKIGELESNLAADTLLAKATKVVDVQKASSTELKSLIDQIDPLNAAMKTARDRGLVLTKDSQISADETAEAQRISATLLGGVAAGTAQIKTTMQEVVESNKNLLSYLRAVESDLRSMRAVTESLVQQRRNQ